MKTNQAKTKKHTNFIDYPFHDIPAESVVEVLGTPTEENTIVIRYKGETGLVNFEILEEISNG